MSMSTIHAPNGHEQQTVSGPRKPDRDAELVERLRRQEPGAPEDLVATYGDRVYRLAIRITGNEQDAEEVVQDALWTAARKIDTFKGESAFGSWIYRITANAAYQKRRGRRVDRHSASWEELSLSLDETGEPVQPGIDWSPRLQDAVLQADDVDLGMRDGVDKYIIRRVDDAVRAAPDIVEGHGQQVGAGVHHFSY